MRNRWFRSGALACALTFLMFGCSSDDGPTAPGGGGGSTAPTFATTAALMTTFLSAFADTTPGLLNDVLADDFVFVLTAETSDQFPDFGSRLSRALVLEVTASMLHQGMLTNAAGLLLPGMDTIDVPMFTQQGAWTPIPPGQEWAGMQSALFQVDFIWVRWQSSVLRSRGMLRVVVDPGAGVVQDWRIRAITDLTSSTKAAEDVPVGSVLCLYWEG